MSFVDNDFALRLCSTFRNYKITQTYPLKINASCPVCLDSATDQFKARFWFYYHDNEPFVHCFNCDMTYKFATFLRDQDEPMYREYILEKRKDEVGFNFGETPKKPEIDLTKFKSVVKFIDELHYCQRLDSLPDNHPIIKYVENRKIPRKQWDKLYFTKQWQELVNHYKQTFDNPKTECRLVIPIYKNGKIESFQGRALTKNPKIKYMTIKAHEHATKVYGVDTVDTSKPVFVMEGPLDSLFIPNSIAITGGQISLDAVPFPDCRVWVLDNEPRHPDVKARVNKLIEAGEKVVLWDKSPWHKKDINEMITDEGATPEEISDYFNNNIVSGLMAKLRSGAWFKV